SSGPTLARIFDPTTRHQGPVAGASSSSSSPLRTKDAAARRSETIHLADGEEPPMWRYSLTALRAAGLAVGARPGLGLGEMGSLYLRRRLRSWRSMASTEAGVAAPAPPA